MPVRTADRDGHMVSHNLRDKNGESEGGREGGRECCMRILQTRIHGILLARDLAPSKYPRCRILKFRCLSRPAACEQTMVRASHCVGFTLPGMIEEPGSFSGRSSSPKPGMPTKRDQ